MGLIFRGLERSSIFSETPCISTYSPTHSAFPVAPPRLWIAGARAGERGGRLRNAAARQRATITTTTTATATGGGNERPAEHGVYIRGTRMARREEDAVGGASERAA